MQVRAAEVAARIAVARRIERAQVVAVAAVLKLDVAKARKEPTVSGISRRHDAVEHIDAVRDAVNQILGRTNPIR